ncbi:MAG: DUF1512 family protein [Candidatus Aenigmarchaeota archaeon]|nr:DUF1512 family protein [Candidatus Aenigmarchaeota archaeon]
MISQLLGGDWISTVVWLVLFVIMILFGPRLMTAQTIMKLEKEAADLEEMARKSKGYIYRKLPKGTDKKKKEKISKFMDFFAVSPISTDPYGIMRKLDHLVKNYDYRFKYFVNQLMPNASEDDKKNVRDALSGAITTHQIAKIVRHYIEMIKKYKMFQYAMVIQMQIPLITRMAKASMKATKAFVDGVPIGDGIGPLVAASMIDGKVTIYKDEEFAVAKTSIEGRQVWVSKADGPGATTGNPGKFLTKFTKKQKINKIITVDAGLKLEGEKTGIIAEGVGVAMGGIGVERFAIEDFAAKKMMPLDAVVVKVSDMEALMPMKKEIYDSVANAKESILDSVKRSKKNEKILLIGVGNTCGVGNDKKVLKTVERAVRKHNVKSKEKKKKSFWKL